MSRKNGITDDARNDGKRSNERELSDLEASSLENNSSSNLASNSSDEYRDRYVFDRLIRKSFENAEQEDCDSSKNSIYSGESYSASPTSASSTGKSSNNQSKKADNQHSHAIRRKIKSSRELSKLVFDFVQERELKWMKDFKNFVKARNLHLSIYDEEPRKIDEKCFAIRQLGCKSFHMGLKDLNSLSGVERKQLETMATVSMKRVSLNYEWTLVMLKHSDKSLAELCKLFCEQYYPGSSLWKFDHVFDNRSELFLMVTHLFARLSNTSSIERERQLAPHYKCAYCEMVGNHFSDECHIKYTKEMREEYLRGYCDKCHRGRDCSKTHKIELQCDRCGEAGFAKDMCPCTMHENVRYVRMICVATRVWNYRMLHSLLFDLENWARAKHIKKTIKWSLLAEYLEFYYSYPANLRKLDRNSVEEEDDDDDEN